MWRSHTCAVTMLDPTEMQRWIAQQCPDMTAQPLIGDVIQSLWSGYGELRRVQLPGQRIARAVLKWVDPAVATSHPRGWGGDVGAARKLRSYAVETAFYRDGNGVSLTRCRTARCLAASRRGESGYALLLEDLDAAGFDARPQAGDLAAVRACLDWLAAFHAEHVGAPVGDLWPVGCYWHLGTRSDEWHAMPDVALKASATAIDTALNTAQWQTRVHGDAKLANFCLDRRAVRVAAVDFQYVGGGVGVRDLVALFASALNNDGLFKHADDLLTHYFSQLRCALADGVKADAIESEWRALWPFVWADYMRFLDGWMPGHARRTAWADARVEETLRHCR